MNSFTNYSQDCFANSEARGLSASRKQARRTTAQAPVVDDDMRLPMRSKEIYDPWQMFVYSERRRSATKNCDDLVNDFDISPKRYNSMASDISPTGVIDFCRSSSLQSSDVSQAPSRSADDEDDFYNDCSTISSGSMASEIDDFWVEDELDAFLDGRFISDEIPREITIFGKVTVPNQSEEYRDEAAVESCMKPEATPASKSRRNQRRAKASQTRRDLPTFDEMEVTTSFAGMIVTPIAY